MTANPLFLFLKGGPGSGNRDHGGRPGQVGGSAADSRLRLIEQSLIAHATPWRHVEFSPEAWDREFPSGEVKTPIGAVKMGAAQRDKLQERQRHRYFGLILPTLESPTYIVAEIESKARLAERIARGEEIDRPSVIQFMRMFRDTAGVHHGFMCVTVSREGVEVSVSSSPRKLRRLARAVKEGAILTVGSALAGETASPGREDGLTKAVSYHHLSAWHAPSDSLFVVYDFGVFAALAGGDHHALLKADIPAGARWITVHANGPDTKGTPLLVQETSPGSGVHHVIGGAGGKLNYLKLRGVKDPGSYHEEARTRRKEKAETRKARMARERAEGTHKAKQAARKQVKADKRAHEQAFIAKVGEKMGWKEHVWNPDDHPELSDQALESARLKHHRQWLTTANETVDRAKKVLLNDADARAMALGHDPLQAGTDVSLDTSDIGLRPTRKAQLGSTVNWGSEAQARGATVTDIAAEAEATAPEPTEATLQRRATGSAIAKELEGFRTGAENAPLEPDALDTNTIIELAKAQKQTKRTRQAAAEANKQIDEDREVKGAYHLQISDVGMDEVRADLLNDLRTASTRAFLGEIGSRYGANQDQTLGGAMTDGAYGAVNALSVTMAGAPLMDRMVVDAVGIGGAAQILARKLKGQLSADEIDDLRGALAEYHTDHYLKATEAALKEAREAEEAASGIDLTEAKDGNDLTEIKALNDRRAEAAAKAQNILGRTLGEMEANAALVAAFGEGPPPDRLSLPIGRLTREDAITRAHAIGLEQGDYRVHTVGQDQYLEISGEGMDKLVAAVDPQRMARYRESRAILTGDRDESGWLPQGVARRPDLAMDDLQPGVAPQLAEPFQPGPDLGQSIKDYIGGRTADGDAPADILADLNSQAMADQAGDPQGYWDAVDALVPRAGTDGKPLLADAHKGAFEAMADEFTERRYGSRQAPLHRQEVPVTQATVDALHRTLAEVPEGVAAYKPIGDMTHAERTGLRQWWERHVGSKDAKGAELAADLHAHEAAEPPKTAPSLFGDDEPNPDWAQWKTEREAKAAAVNASGLTWSRYVEGMGSPEAAMAATQDLVRSAVARAFAQHHNRLNPDAPLKVGRASLRGGLDHLDMVDPRAREARMEERRRLTDDLRSRDQGRYAAGAVAGKLTEHAERRAAEGQSQVDMFGFSQPQESADAPEKPPSADERYTLGHAAERQIGRMMAHVGQNFRPGDQIKLWQPSMDGKGILGQRAIKFIEANKHVALGLGVGTGKTIIALGAFTDLHAQGLAKKGVFVVPASVQGQFHCVSGGTILDDPIRKISLSFAEWMSTGIEPFVLGLDESGSILVKRASVPFIKGIDAMYRVVTNDGSEIVVTGRHRFLTPDGWTELGSLGVSSRVFAGGRDWSEVADARENSLDEDFQGGCRPLQSFHGEQPRLYAKIGQYAPPSQADALRRSRESLPTGDLSRKAGCSRMDEQSVLHASCSFATDALAQTALHYEGQELAAATARWTRQDCQGCDQPSTGMTDLQPAMPEVGRCSIHMDQASESRCLAFLPDAELSRPLFESDGLSMLRTPRFRPCAETRLRLFCDEDDRDAVIPQDQDVSVCEQYIGGFFRFASQSMTPACHLQPTDECHRLQHEQGLESSVEIIQDQEVLFLPRQGKTTEVRSSSLETHHLRPFSEVAIHQSGGMVAACFDSWVEISSIEYVGYEAVYDIHVPDIHNYFAHGLLNHNSEALRYLEPGKFKWHAKPGASREERLAALRDPDTHFAVVTHQALRDDLLHLGAQAEGIEPAAMAAKLADMNPAGRKAWADKVMTTAGIKPDFVVADEAHGALNRKGKENSALANVLDAVGHNATYHVLASADVSAKNDVSETADLLQKLDPDRYADRAAFLRRYGGNTPDKKAALLREMTPYLMSGENKPPVRVTRSEHAVELNAGQDQAIAAIQKAVAKARLGRIKGTVAIDALRELSPGAFEGVPEDRHEAVAKQLEQSLGVIQEAAMRRAIDDRGQSAKLDAVAKLAKDRAGKPGVVFAHHLSVVNDLKARLEKEGHRVGVLTGDMTAKERDAVRLGFHPEAGEPKHDILVMSDAGAVGINAQRGQWLVQYDVPQTALVHAQRQGRINRLGQKNDVELIDLVGQHPFEERARRRLRDKYALRETLTDPAAGLDDTGLAGHLAQRQSSREAGQGGLF